MRYDSETIEKVRNANDIVDVIGRHVRLTKKGTNYFGLCPFHGEKTASFSVNQRKQFFHCFGCGVGGSVIDFLMQYDNLSFQEAVKQLADNAHIELPESTDREDRHATELRQRLLDVNKEAAIYYHNLLRSPEGKTGLEYFKQKRRLKDETITHFGLGFAAKELGADNLYKHLKEKGYDDELLKQSGLVTFSEKGARDKFWNRVMFPIMDTNNRVIGFGGRVMGDGEPKYLNSPETYIFDKSSQLYGLNFAKKSRQKYLLLCEGYMDVIALHQAGFTNAVASLGTAFTDKHARLLKRYTDSVILTQDSDKAGINAKLRAFPILHEAGLKVKVLDTGKYKDPDEYIKAEGAEGYEHCIKAAKNAFIYVISVLRDSFDLSDPAEKTAFVRETVDRLCIFRETMERDNYIDAVSREFMLDRDELKRMTERKMENGGSYVYRDMPVRRSASAGRRTTVGTTESELAGGTVGAGASAVKSGSDTKDADCKGTDAEAANVSSAGDIDSSSTVSLDTSSTLSYEMLLISWLTERPDLADKIFTYIKPEEFAVRSCRLLAEEIERLKSNFEPAAFLDNASLSEAERRDAAAIFAEPLHTGSILDKSKNEIEKGLTEAIRAIRLTNIESEMTACGTDMAKFQTLLQEKNKLRNFKVVL